MCEGHLPTISPAPEVILECAEAVLAYERAAYEVNIHGALAIAEELCRSANKRWGDASKAAKGDDDAYEAALADAFCYLRTVTLLMHPAVPTGCELICEKLGFDEEGFFSWEHAFDGVIELAQDAGERPEEHRLVELPPRFDFFEAHPSQARR